MPLIDHKITAFLKKVVDLSDTPSENMSPADIKAWFDSSPEELRVKINGVIDRLSSTTPGDSGAKNIGVETISGLTGNDIQTLLKALKTYADTKTDKTGNHEGTWQGKNFTSVNDRLNNIEQGATTDTEIIDARQKENGTTFPTLPERLKDVDAQLADIAINIRSYWITTLEAALQSAHDALPSTGGIILIPQNMNVDLTVPIGITKPNVCIMSINGRYGLSKITGKTADMVMFNVDNYGFTLKEIAIFGDGLVGDTSTATIIPFKINATVLGDADCFLDNVFIANCKNAGELKGRNIRIKNNTLVSNCHNGFRILGGFTDMRGVELDDIRFHSIGKGNTTGVKTSCIYVEPTANYREVKINVYADDCENVVTGAIATGHIQNSMSYRAHGEMFNIDNSLLTTPITDRQLKVNNNSVAFQSTTNGSYGMKFKGAGFQINDNSALKSSKHGIFLESVTDSEIHDNSIVNCGYEANSDGIHADVNSVRNSIKTNKVRKNDANCIIRYGVAIEGGDNEFDSNTTYGLTAGNEFYINPSTNKLAFGDTRATFLKQRVTQGTSAPSTGRYLAGDICYNTAPTAEKNITHWTCVSGGTSGTWRAFGTGQGTTANRPALTTRDIGYQYFDTDLQKLFYYDGVGYKQISA